jgi:hypothetical protein
MVPVYGNIGQFVWEIPDPHFLPIPRSPFFLFAAMCSSHLIDVFGISCFKKRPCEKLFKGNGTPFSAELYIVRKIVEISPKEPFSVHIKYLHCSFVTFKLNVYDQS